MKTEAEHRARDAARKRELRAYRIANRICVGCGAGLLDEDTTTYCIDCRPLRAMYSRRYWRKNPETARRSRQNWQANNPERVRQMSRDLRMKRKTSGICLDCTQPCMEDNVYCEFHREYHRVKALQYMRRKKPNAARRLKGRQLLPKKKRTVRAHTPNPTPIDIVRDRPADSDMDTARGRLLRVMRFLDWTPVYEIFAILGVSLIETDTREWDVYMGHVSRFVKRGLAERYGKPGGYHYRLTKLGRDEVEKLIASTYREAA